MWDTLDTDKKDIYKELTLAYASLSKAFAQKEDFSIQGKDKTIKPIINSEFQKASFQKAFGGTIYDSNNTLFDALLSIEVDRPFGIYPDLFFYLVNFKIFDFNDEYQKVTQFKEKFNAWNKLILKMKDNVKNKNLSVYEINNINYKLYHKMAINIATTRNKRFKSFLDNLLGSNLKNGDYFNIAKQGFVKNISNTPLKGIIYHVLMPAISKDNEPVIYIGEIDDSLIDIGSLKIKGCTDPQNPTDFVFYDKKHTYKYISADSQLYMNFNNKNIIKEVWNVKFAEDAYSFFSDIAKKIYNFSSEDSNNSSIESFCFNTVTTDFNIQANTPKIIEPYCTECDGNNEGVQASPPKIIESYCWYIAPKGKLEKTSGFNSFYSTDSKLEIGELEQDLAYEYELEYENNSLFKDLISKLQLFSNNDNKAINKFKLRDEICKILDILDIDTLTKTIKSLIFKPFKEIYIPIPNAKKFHTMHPNFFGKDVVSFQKDNSSKLKLPLKKSYFILIFEPFGGYIESFITQENGKFIKPDDVLEDDVPEYESEDDVPFEEEGPYRVTNTSYSLGYWLKTKIFQLENYELLTTKKLNDIRINGIRLYKTDKSIFSRNTKLKNKVQEEEVHIQFIWIDETNLPKDFIG